MRGGNFLDCGRAAGSRTGLQLRDVAEIDGIVMNGEESDIVVAAYGIDLGRGYGRRGRSARGGVSKIVAIDALDDRFGNGHLTGGSLVTDAVAIFGDVTSHDPAAIFQHYRIARRKRGGGCTQSDDKRCLTHTPILPSDPFKACECLSLHVLVVTVAWCHTQSGFRSAFSCPQHALRC